MTDTPHIAQTPAPPPLPASPRRPRLFARYGTVLKMAALGTLVLLLLIPLAMIRSVLNERLQRHHEAVAEITSTWGDAQAVNGPILIVPYKYRVKVAKTLLVNGRMENVETTETQTAQACFLPEDLKIVGHLTPNVLHRGIYQAVVYSGKLELSGTFAKPVFDDWKVAPEDVAWEDATVVVMVADLRGAQEALTLTWDGQAFPLVPGAKIEGFSSAVHARLKNVSSAQDRTPFSLNLSLNGSTGLRLAPIGRQTQVRLTSPWPDPSFCGAFLPSERKVSPAGFEADWHVSYYGRPFPQQWSSQDRVNPVTPASIESSMFGVDLIPVVDSYRYVERSIKYGVLFIVLIFTAFFLFEALASVRVHPFQYTLVGMALCLFYLALLSLSEVIPFGAAYLAGAAVSTLMITLYSARALRSARRALAIGAELAAIYGFLFVILCLQDYSLLLGTAGLFLALAIVMFATRNIDWYVRDEAN